MTIGATNVVTSVSPKPRGGSRKPSGFSLLELLAVVTILGIIALVIIPRITFSSTTAKKNACFQNKAEINSAAERYYFDNGSVPADLAALNTYFPDGVPVCPVSGNAYALGANGRVTSHTGDTHP
jgi:prepilin-type N-terminal cleavage/methylation domain-containing protein